MVGALEPVMEQSPGIIVGLESIDLKWMTQCYTSRFVLSLVQFTKIDSAPYSITFFKNYDVTDLPSDVITTPPLSLTSLASCIWCSCVIFLHVLNFYFLPGS